MDSSERFFDRLGFAAGMAGAEFWADLAAAKAFDAQLLGRSAAAMLGVASPLESAAYLARRGLDFDSVGSPPESDVVTRTGFLLWRVEVPAWQAEARCSAVPPAASTGPVRSGWVAADGLWGLDVPDGVAALLTVVRARVIGGRLLPHRRGELRVVVVVTRAGWVGRWVFAAGRGELRVPVTAGQWGLLAAVMGRALGTAVDVQSSAAPVPVRAYLGTLVAFAAVTAIRQLQDVHASGPALEALLDPTVRSQVGFLLAVRAVAQAVEECGLTSRLPVDARPVVTAVAAGQLRALGAGRVRGLALLGDVAAGTSDVAWTQVVASGSVALPTGWPASRDLVEWAGDDLLGSLAAATLGMSGADAAAWCAEFDRRCGEPGMLRDVVTRAGWSIGT